MTTDEKGSYETALAFSFVRVCDKIRMREKRAVLFDKINENLLEFKMFLLKEAQSFFPADLSPEKKEVIAVDEKDPASIIFVFNDVCESIKTLANIEYLYGGKGEKAPEFEKYLYKKAKSFSPDPGFKTSLRARRGSGGGC